MPLPPIPEDLLKALDLAFPLVSPRLDQTDREIWCEVGKRQVVDCLKSHFKHQQETSATDVFRKQSQGT